MEKNTAGPWKAAQVTHNSFEIRSFAGTLIAEVYWQQTGQETQANAELIERAPVMQQALRDALVAMEAQSARLSSHGIECAIATVRAALAPPLQSL